MVGGESSPQEYAKFAGVIIGITVLSAVLASISARFSLTEWMAWFMGVFFLVFASFKLIGYRMFAEMFQGYDIIAKRFQPYAYAYPFIELILAALYLTNSIPLGRDVFTVVIMGVGSIGVAEELQRRTGIHCACLGNVIKLPLSTTSLVEDVGMGLMALTMLVLR